MKEIHSLLMSGETILKSYMEVTLTNKRLFLCSKDQPQYNYVFFDKLDSIDYSLKHKPVLIVIGSLFLALFLFFLFLEIKGFYLALFGILGILSLVGYHLTRKHIFIIKSGTDKVETFSNTENWDNLEGFSYSISEAKEKILFK